MRGKRRTRLRHRHVGGGEDGFTLVEVMVAFLIIAIIAAAGTSLTVRGLRATLEAKQLSQAKNLVNEQVERMRGLPFFVGVHDKHRAGGRARQLLPGHGRRRASAPNCAADATTWVSNKAAWTGYVAAGAARCAFEPTAGAFYRTVVDPAVGWLDADGGRGLDPVPRPRTGRRLGGAGAAPCRPATPGTPPDRTPRQPVRSRHSSPRCSVPRAEPSSTRRHARTSPTGAVGHLRSRPRRAPPPSPLTRPWPTATRTGSSSAPCRATARSRPITKAAVEARGGSMQTETGRVDGAAEIANSPGGDQRDSPQERLDVLRPNAVGATHTSGVTATGTLSDPGFGAPRRRQRCGRDVRRRQDP